MSDLRQGTAEHKPHSFEHMLNDVLGGLSGSQGSRINAYLQTAFNFAMVREMQNGEPANYNQISDGLANGFMAMLANLHGNVSEQLGSKAGGLIAERTMRLLAHFYEKEFANFTAASTLEGQVHVNPAAGTA